VIDVMEILVHWHAGRSKNEMAQSLGVDRKTLRKYIAPAEAAGIVPGGPAKSEQEWAGLVRGPGPAGGARTGACYYAGTRSHPSGCANIAHPRVLSPAALMAVTAHAWAAEFASSGSSSSTYMLNRAVPALRSAERVNPRNRGVCCWISSRCRATAETLSASDFSAPSMTVVLIKIL